MKSLFLLLPLALFSGFSCYIHGQNSPANDSPGVKNMLVYTHTNGYRHASIESGVTTLFNLAKEEGIRMEHTEDSLVFNDTDLSKYQLVVFLSTTGDVLGEHQEQSFRKFIEGGGAFMGIHAATDTEYGWPWYGKLVGAYFESHPDQQEAKLVVVDQTHPSTSHMKKTWKHYDEWYNFKDINPKLQILMRLDETSYEGGKNGTNHPIAWFHENAGGRVFYTGLGHSETTFKNSIFQEHLRGGLRYCLELE